MDYWLMVASRLQVLLVAAEIGVSAKVRSLSGNGLVMIGLQRSVRIPSHLLTWSSSFLTATPGDKIVGS